MFVCATRSLLLKLAIDIVTTVFCVSHQYHRAGQDVGRKSFTSGPITVLFRK